MSLVWKLRTLCSQSIEFEPFQPECRYSLLLAVFNISSYHAKYESHYDIFLHICQYTLLILTPMNTPSPFSRPHFASFFLPLSNSPLFFMSRMYVCIHIHYVFKTRFPIGGKVHTICSSPFCLLLPPPFNLHPLTQPPSAFMSDILPWYLMLGWFIRGMKALAILV